MYCYFCGIFHLQKVKEAQPLWHFQIRNHFYWVFSITPVVFGFLVPCGVPVGGWRGTVSSPPFCNYQYSASLSAPLNHSPRPPWWTCSPPSTTPRETFWNHHRVPPMWLSAPSAWFAYFPPFFYLSSSSVYSFFLVAFWAPVSCLLPSLLTAPALPAPVLCVTCSITETQTN